MYWRVRGMACLLVLFCGTASAQAPLDAYPGDAQVRALIDAEWAFRLKEFGHPDEGEGPRLSGLGMAGPTASADASGGAISPAARSFLQANSGDVWR